MGNLTSFVHNHFKMPSYSRLGLQAKMAPRASIRTSLLPLLNQTLRCFTIQPRSSSTHAPGPITSAVPIGVHYAPPFPLSGHRSRRSSSFTRQKIALPKDGTTLITAIHKGEDPLYLLRRYFIQDELTKDLATVCLEGFLKQLEALPSSEAIARKVQKEKVGQLVLQWLWDDYKNIRNPEDHQLVDAIADLLVQEGQEEMAWEWIFLPVKIKSSKETSGKDIQLQIIWRGHMVSALARAKAKDVRGSLDDAIEVIFRAWKFSRLRRQQQSTNGWY